MVGWVEIRVITVYSFVSSGDGYNRRFAGILSDFEEKEMFLDDTVHFDRDIECHWWRTIDFLEKVGNAGIIVNLKKCRFCQNSVEFAGLRISDERIKPLPKYLHPKFSFSKVCQRYVKSWHLKEIFSVRIANLFGLKIWTNKSNIQSDHRWCNKKGVDIFNLEKLTCLRPDWPKQGYFLMQKHCTCNTCATGWTLAGSSSLNGAEKNYAAIEGESLAVAWSSEQTKYFTKGCKVVVTDDPPLVKIVVYRSLNEIEYARNLRLKHSAQCHDFLKCIIFLKNLPKQKMLHPVLLPDQQIKRWFYRRVSSNCFIE